MTMDVAIITSHMSFKEHGGANYSRHLLAQQLEARGHDVTVYTLNFADENHVPIPHDYALEEIRVDGTRTAVGATAKFMRHLRRVFAENDIVHAYVPLAIPLCSMYRVLARDDTPLVGTLNGYTLFCTNTARMGDGCWKNCGLRENITHSRLPPDGSFTPLNLPRMVFNQTLMDRLTSRVDALMALSPATRDVHAEVGIDDEIIDVVPNMVDPRFDSTPEIVADGSGPVRILYVGRVDAMKNVDDLIEGLALLDGDGDDWEAHIVGDNVLGFGEPLEYYADLAADRGVGDRVTFHGWVDYTELGEHYAAADVFVHPAHWPEPFGRTIIEAMQHGLPVVCSDVGAPPWVADSACETFAPGDTVGLAGVLESLVDSPERRAAMAANCEIELVRFDHDRVTDRIEGIYQEVSA